MGSESTEDLIESSSFRKHLPDLSLPRFTVMKKQTPYEYAKQFIESGHSPWIHGLFSHWKYILKDSYTGITNDGG